MTAPTRVAVLTEIVSPYRIPAFNALALEEGIDLEVIFLAASEKRRSWRPPTDQIRFPYTILKSVQLAHSELGGPMLLSRGIFRFLSRGRYQCIILGGYHQPTYWLALAWAKAKDVRVILWSESTLKDARPRSFLRERGKRAAVKRADAFLAAGSAHAEYLAHLGAPRELIWRAPDSVDNDRFWKGADAARSELSSHRSRLRLPGPVVLYVGRLWDLKGIPDLLTAWRSVRKDHPTATLLLVGTGPDEASYKDRVAQERIEGVRFEGYVKDEDLTTYYGVADVFAFPTRSDPWGLVLNEAMAAGLPLVCSRAAGAADDLAEHGGNAILHDPGDVGAIAKGISSLLADEKARGRMGARSREIIQRYSPHHMARGFADAILERRGTDA